MYKYRRSLKRANKIGCYALIIIIIIIITSCARGDTICLRPWKLTISYLFIHQVAPVPACWLFKTSATSWPFYLLTLKAVFESRMTWATYMPILVFLGLSVLELGPMYATDRQTDDRQTHRLMPPPYGGGGIIIEHSNFRCIVVLVKRITC